MWHSRSSAAARATDPGAAAGPSGGAQNTGTVAGSGRLSFRRVIQVIVLLAMVFSILVAVFAVQNTTPVAVQFLTFHADTVAVSVLVLISAAFGALAMLLLGVAREVSLRWSHRAVGQQLKAAQARVAELEAAQSTATKATPVGEEKAATPSPHTAA